ncbi:hypothetical protein B0H19DRAFT_1065329 [Mycena capillaripes]|nr:hypothetical protein B0H19DRAFT_1065329 [Mycena capillaripes]
MLHAAEVEIPSSISISGNTEGIIYNGIDVEARHHRFSATALAASIYIQNGEHATYTLRVNTASGAKNWIVKWCRSSKFRISGTPWNQLAKWPHAWEAPVEEDLVLESRDVPYIEEISAALQPHLNIFEKLNAEDGANHPAVPAVLFAKSQKTGKRGKGTEMMRNGGIQFTELFKRMSFEKRLFENPLKAGWARNQQNNPTHWNHNDREKENESELQPLISNLDPKRKLSQPGGLHELLPDCGIERDIKCGSNEIKHRTIFALYPRFTVYTFSVV